ncbi:HDOD domain-containing protein [Helicobacter winghamensis]|uniref:HDOD domain-containing protein n=1 Tax=Helicobacter winghamensis TaxID=157268 RepID=A0A2N3PI11_9HELI|nr:HDOD domain-containing protein [Helicobacter winghamensis]EEO25606.1 HDOD domain protein [Helicobacter winghamensis ATCC BAA-430]PKT78248.1 HDOD domain-containing protein [Helicobacter winghamensis]PKT80157.1 HDOD domain-containing protein [Helicobacter winghamensis]PKT80264.1 HDOD domain-containing protein [Helicobacter winghamensis]QOQ97999.1 HDOD domain-containing protein [Helicobacter winghamensis]
MNPLLVETIKELPPLPQTVIELRNYVDSSGADLEVSKVAEILSKDPLIVGELLRLANSPFYGLSRQVSTIQQVVSLLGAGTIKNTVMANAIRSNFSINVSPYGLDNNAFLTNCSKEVDFISAWLREEDKALANELIPCAMLLRLGMILLSDMLIKSGKDKEFLEQNKANNFQDVHNLENQYCGVDSISFLGFLFNHWEFDERLIQSIAYIHNPHAATQEIKKNSYALAVTNCLFEPYHPLSQFNSKKSIALINEAIGQGVNFNMANFLAKLPEEAKENLIKDD